MCVWFHAGLQVSDFGLSRAGPAPSLEPSDSTVEGAGQRGAQQPEEEALVPVRWSAPEVLRSGGGWSEKSDGGCYRTQQGLFYMRRS